ncbi:hypothetical protein FJV41_46540 [Myxococcus llanfairpwllgwyngyllgogerychwyrndrobwllllantysiliogogogochensis]|uniref:Uncharacterized protein n=1 Tax=Myxococcus llanfairpwllgwyngyllgogerychwyrndrobwllllantysiliogogogochensis TaxID=2590453 RepID=A0A540WJS6_9BACT|nr:hypothetical protein [Myxococcus llanfairpwllgwyngyllgogerychwyrndrobwllllantysiliogogogochensis]TQF09077.1 hypothetical protein FJV41_46540 [Myxococcus llanfairpwllgwyngyllgogerychwyrndrobwllllantysiliogogogochensis]
MTTDSIRRLADRLRGHADVTAFATPSGLALTGRRKYAGRTAHLSADQVALANRNGTDIRTVVREALGIPTDSPDAGAEPAPEPQRTTLSDLAAVISAAGSVVAVFNAPGSRVPGEEVTKATDAVQALLKRAVQIACGT